MYGKEPVQQRRLLTVQKITAAIDYKTEHTEPKCSTAAATLQVTLRVADSHGILPYTGRLKIHFKKVNRPDFRIILQNFQLPYCSLTKEQKCGKEEVSNDLLHNESEILTYIYSKRK